MTGVNVGTVFYEQRLKAIFARLFDLGVTIVLAAGNEGNSDDPKTLDMTYPQSFGDDNDDNFPLITVGGINNNGSYWPATVPHRPGLEGSMSVYAQSTNVQCATNQLPQDDQDILNGAPNLLSNTNPANPGYSQLMDGTSFAAPDVA